MFEKYDAYQRSTNSILPLYPLHWTIKKIKHVAKVYNGDSLSNEKKDTFSSVDLSSRPYISSKDISVEDSSINYNSGLSIPNNLRGYKVAPTNSTLICIEGGSAGRKVAFTELEVSFVNKLACLYSKSEVNKFIFYTLKSEPFKTQFKLAMSGLIGGVAISDIENFSIFLPPITEQKTIVSFLDKKVNEIDHLIRIEENKIKLLKEHIRITINKAVIKGLNPEVEFKNSKIDWVGEIPKHWEVLRFKNLFDQSNLSVRDSDEVVTSYRDGQVTLRSNRRVGGYTEAILEQGYQGVRKGQLVLNSMDAFEGAIGVSDSDGKCTPEYVVCNPKSDGISQYYFAYLLREMALAKYIQVICSAVRQRAVRIRFNNLAKQEFIVPPKEEQEAIVKFIESEIEKLNSLISELNKKIISLKEYKTTLISDAITGKIKVA